MELAGAGYSAKKGVLHFNFNGDAACPTAMSEEQSDAYIVRVILAQQYSLEKGLELFGEKADAAVNNELTQIHDMETYEPVDPKTMTYEDRKKVLGCLLFITEKGNGDIKARKIADGSKQRLYDGYGKSDGSSPTVATDSIFLTGVADAKEGREVVS